MAKEQTADETPSETSSTGYNKRFEDLTFTDDYIFKLVMERSDVFEAFLKVIMPQLEVEKLELYRSSFRWKLKSRLQSIIFFTAHDLMFWLKSKEKAAATRSLSTWKCKSAMKVKRLSVRFITLRF